MVTVKRSKKTTAPWQELSVYLQPGFGLPCKLPEPVNIVSFHIFPTSREHRNIVQLCTTCALHLGPPHWFPSQSTPGEDTGIFARSHKKLEDIMYAQTSWMHLYWQDFWTILTLWSLISATIPKMSTYWEQILSPKWFEFYAPYDFSRGLKASPE